MTAQDTKRSGTPPLVPPPDVTSMVLSFGPDVYMQWPSLEVGQKWWLWDVWDRRGHTQGAHRIVTAVLYDRALAVARQSMNVTPQEALALANPTDPPR